MRGGHVEQHLLGRQYRPQLANLPDQRLWRIDPAADYGPLDRAACGRIDVDRITQHWEDMCRVAVSIHSGEVSAHILRLADDDPYRREIKSQANLTEGRHDLARRVFHGKKGEVTKVYYDGMEDQLSALGLVLNCVVLWNTVYMDRALAELRAQGYPVLVEDHYSFHLPDLGGSHRPLRDPDAEDDA